MNILVIAAHPDDEVLGCGGAMARWAAEGHAVHTLLVSDGESSRLPDASAQQSVDLQSARGAAARSACEILGGKSVHLLGLPDNRLDGMELLDVVKPIEQAIERLCPDVVLTNQLRRANV